MAAQTISERLRMLKDQNGWTSQQMADAVGMSRRTLESYMRREKAASPGLEALSLIATGLGVSLDWLAGVGVNSRVREMLLVRVSAERAALPVIENLFATMKEGKATPEAGFLAVEIGAQAAQVAEIVSNSVLTSVQMATMLRRFEADQEVSLLKKIDALRSELDRLRESQCDDLKKLEA